MQPPVRTRYGIRGIQAKRGARLVLCAGSWPGERLRVGGWWARDGDPGQPPHLPGSTRMQTRPSNLLLSRHSRLVCVCVLLAEANIINTRTRCSPFLGGRPAREPFFAIKKLALDGCLYKRLRLCLYKRHLSTGISRRTPIVWVSARYPTVTGNFRLSIREKLTHRYPKKYLISYRNEFFVSFDSDNKFIF